MQILTKLQGYALIQFSTFDEAHAAIEGTNGTELLGQRIETSFTFVRGPNAGKQGQNRNGRADEHRPRSSRSRSPTGGLSKALADRIEM